MRRVNHAWARWLIFTAYAAIAALFCVLLLFAASREMARTESRAATEGAYMEALNCAKEAINRLRSASAAFALNRNPDSAKESVAAALAFREKAGRLLEAAAKRESDRSAAIPADDAAAKALSFALAAEADAKTDGPERTALSMDDARGLEAACDEAAGQLQILLREETDRIAVWRKESLRFFTRLQLMVALFFIGATAFSVAAAIAYGAILRGSIRKLAEAAEALREGRLDFRLANPPGGEIGRLMDDFNVMAGRIEEQAQALTKANGELKEQAEALLAAHRHKDRFLANMSHELRTPLNAVMGFADLIAQRSEASGQAKSKADAERIAAAAEHLLELISGLLEIARFDAGQLKPELNDFDLGACLEGAAAMLKPLAAKKGLEFRVEVAGGLRARADERMIRQIIINLLGNALKFTESGFVSLKAAEAGDKIEIAVEDSGIGISESDAKALFTDFHRAETGLTSKYPGAGIGLALTKRLVELHSGSVIFSSSLGKGTSFIVRIPNPKA